MTEDELCKAIDDLNETRLTSLLELALRTSSSYMDPYKDCVQVELFPTGIREMLLNMITIGTPYEKESFETAGPISIPGVEALSLKFEVKWPVSLVLNDRAVTNYQLIFRHLFFCKHVERRLCEAWIHSKCKGIKAKVHAEKAAGFALRQKMLNFVQNLLYYMAFEVKFEKTIKKSHLIVNHGRLNWKLLMGLAILCVSALGAFFLISFDLNLALHLESRVKLRKFCLFF